MEGKTIEIVLYIMTIILSVCSGIYITVGKERYKDEKPVFSKKGYKILKNNIRRLLDLEKQGKNVKVKYEV